MEVRRIKDIPIHLRPREKAWLNGINSLENGELLALIIGSGINNYSALDIGYHLANNHFGLIGLLKYGQQQFLNVPGINKANALKLLALCEIARRMQVDRNEEVRTFKNALQVYEKYRLTLGSLHQEVLYLIMLNKHNHLISEKTIYMGSMQKLNLSLRDIYEHLFTYKAQKFILMHNHPQGDYTPSKMDIETTIIIQKEASRLGLTLLDHIIITLNGYYSMKESQILG